MIGGEQNIKGHFLRSNATCPFHLVREVEGCQTGFIVSLKSGGGSTGYPTACTYIVTCFVFKFICGFEMVFIFSET